MASMIETAANDNGNAALTELLAAFGRALEERLGTEATFAEREAARLELANALCRADQGIELSRRAEGFTSAVVLVDRKEYRRHEPGRVVYHGCAVASSSSSPRTAKSAFAMVRPSYRSISIRA